MRSGLAEAVTEERFDNAFDDLEPALRRLMGQRRGRTTLMAGSADEAWGDLLASTFSLGDRVLVVRLGDASGAWAERVAERGLDVETLDAPPGAGVPALELTRRLEADNAARLKAVFVRHSEPGTGVRASIAAVRDALDAADHGALLLVDASHALPSMPVRMEDWGADAIVTEGGLLPAETVLRTTSRRLALGSRPVAMPKAAALRELEARLDALFEEGIGAVQARYGRYAEAARRAVRAWGFETVASDRRCSSDNVTVARAVGPRATSITIEHGTAGDEATLLARIEAAEHRLRAMGVAITSGAGVGAAAGWLMATGSIVRPTAYA